MKKVLILNFSSEDTQYRVTKLIKGIKRKHSSAEICVATYQKSCSTVKNIRYINSFFAFDEEKFSTIIKSDIFADTLAFNMFSKYLEGLMSVSWDQIINFSNNNFSSRIATIMSNNEISVSGLHYSNYNKINAQDFWSKYKLVAASDFSLPLLNCVDQSLKELELKSTTTISNSIDYESAIHLQVEKTFGKIRSLISNDCNIIGIKISSPLQQDGMSFEATVSLIKKLFSNKKYYPIIITSAEKEEKVFAQELNKHFENSLIVIEATTRIAPAISKQIDLLVSSKSTIKEIADTLGTPIIEIVTSGFTDHTSNPNNIVICTESSNLSKRGFADDLLISIVLMTTEIELNIKPSLSDIYITSRDSFGAKLNKYNSSKDIGFLDYTVRRVLVAKLSGEKMNFTNELLNSNFTYSTIASYTKVQRLYTTEASKLLLGTLRSLLRTKKEPKLSGEFLNSLQKLINTESFGISTLPRNILINDLELIDSNDKKESLIKVEKLLYRFKQELGVTVSMVKELEDVTEHLKKTIFSQHVQSAQIAI